MNYIIFLFHDDCSLLLIISFYINIFVKKVQKLTKHLDSKLYTCPDWKILSLKVFEGVVIDKLCSIGAIYFLSKFHLLSFSLTFPFSFAFSFWLMAIDQFDDLKFLFYSIFDSLSLSLSLKWLSFAR